MALRALGISRAAFYDLAIAVDDEHMGNHRHAQCAAEIAVGVEDNLIFPVVVIDEGLHLLGVLGLVDADGIEFHARFFLPVFIDLCDV